MNGVGPCRPCRVDQLRSIEIPVAVVEAHSHVGLRHVGAGRVGFGVDGDGADAEPAAGGEHAAGDLSAIGDQNSGDHLAPPAISACRDALTATNHAEIASFMALTSGRRRSSTSPRSGRSRWRTGTFRARCGYRAGR